MIETDQINDLQAKHRQKILSLNEPVSQTIKRDLLNICVKLKYAMLPSMRQTGKKQLRNWDLWGPLLLCLVLCATLSFRTQSESKTIITSVFVIMWLGSLIVYVNANFLGSEMSFFQSASLLGYCLFPINVASFILDPIYFQAGHRGRQFPLGYLVYFIDYLASIAFVGEMIPQKKRKLALYPIIIFYLFLSWFVLIV